MTHFDSDGAPTLLPPPSRSSSPKLLGSDDEGAMPIIPLTLRNLPSHFPTLPPKHTYMRTPVRTIALSSLLINKHLMVIHQASPAKKRALPSLEKKLKTQALVQESLKNLLLATEENENQEDGELLGHIVNWEATTYPKKRWKI
jgi:transcription initiation factor TFIID subunit 8